MGCSTSHDAPKGRGSASKRVEDSDTQIIPDDVGECVIHDGSRRDKDDSPMIDCSRNNVSLQACAEVKEDDPCPCVALPSAKAQGSEAPQKGTGRSPLKISVAPPPEGRTVTNAPARSNNSDVNHQGSRNDNSESRGVDAFGGDDSEDIISPIECRGSPSRNSYNMWAASPGPPLSTFSPQRPPPRPHQVCDGVSLFKPTSPPHGVVAIDNNSFSRSLAKDGSADLSASVSKQRSTVLEDIVSLSGFSSCGERSATEATDPTRATTPTSCGLSEGIANKRKKKNLSKLRALFALRLAAPGAPPSESQPTTDHAAAVEEEGSPQSCLSRNMKQSDPQSRLSRLVLRGDSFVTALKPDAAVIGDDEHASGKSPMALPTKPKERNERRGSRGGFISVVQSRQRSSFPNGSFGDQTMSTRIVRFAPEPLFATTTISHDDGLLSELFDE